MAMVSVALTGGIASGKSTFGKFLARLGAQVVDADELVHRLHEPGGKGALTVAHLFGPDFLHPDGSTNRPRLGQMLFADPQARKALETAIHPLVRSELLAWKNGITATSPSLCIAQIPLLFETGWQSDWDTTATVETTPESQRERLIGRGFSPEQAHARIAAQLSATERIERARFVIRNDAGLDHLQQLAALFYQRMTAH